MRSPLDGIRVADFSHMVAGPYGTLQLAYYGADVIKIESSIRPDTWRLRDGNADIEKSRPFNDHNKNKRSVTINMKNIHGVELAKRLIAVSDVVVENFSYGVMERLGLSYEKLRNIKEDLVMVRLQGQGQTGPRKEYVTWGPNLLSFSGMTYLWSGTDSEEPVGSQTAYPDYVVGITAAYAIMAALYFREKTGKGQQIDLSQAEVTAGLIGTAYAQFLNNGVVTEPLGNKSIDCAPYGCYRCNGTDKWCVIAVTSDEEWHALCEVIGRSDWMASSELNKVEGRLIKSRELDKGIEDWTRQRLPKEIMELLQSAGVPAGMVADGKDLVEDKNLKGRGFLVNIDHPALGNMTFPGIPTLSEIFQGSINRHAPLLGQDTEEVCRDVLQMSEAEITWYREAGALI